MSQRGMRFETQVLRLYRAAHREINNSRRTTDQKALFRHSGSGSCAAGGGRSPANRPPAAGLSKNRPKSSGFLAQGQLDWVERT
jgi:hypothetical protein